MKMMVAWLLGVPVAIAFFFSAFAVDASKLFPAAQEWDAKRPSAAAPGDVTTHVEYKQTGEHIY